MKSRFETDKGYARTRVRRVIEALGEVRKYDVSKEDEAQFRLAQEEVDYYISCHGKDAFSMRKYEILEKHRVDFPRGGR